MHFDTTTIAVLIALHCAVTALAIAIVSQRYPRPLAHALNIFSAGKVAMAIAFVLIANRGTLPDLVSAVIGNMLAIAAIYTTYAAARAMHSKTSGLLHPALILGVVGISTFYFTGIHPDLRFLRGVTSAAALWAMSALFIELLRHRDRGRAHAVAMLAAAIMIALLLLRILHTLAGPVLPWAPLTDDGVENLVYAFIYFATTLGAVVVVLMASDAFNRELAALSATDQLSNLPNRRHLMERGEEEMQRALRNRRGLSVALIDIDHFKRINDRWGHATGDRAIRAVADACKSALRNIDLVGRLGGEEFVVLMPETELARAMEVAERLRQAVGSIVLTAGSGEQVLLAASIGVAAMAEDSSFEALLGRADTAMYAAKEGGRNRVCADNPVPARLSVAPSEAQPQA